VRGVNVYPSAIEGVVRRFSAVREFRIEVGAMPGPEVRIAAEIDGAAGDTLQRLAAELRASLGVRIDVTAVPPGTLPRFEHKARRVVRRD